MTKPIKSSQRRLCVRRYAVILLAMAGFLVGCDSNVAEKIDLSERVDDAELRKTTPERDDDVLRFGFDRRAGPQEDAKQYLSFLKYLEEATGLQFEPRFTPRGGTVVDDLGQDVVQFAAVGAKSYIAAHAKYDAVPLARGLNAEGRAEYQSVIVVAPDSPIQTVEELRGRRFAFSSATSTQGHLIPRISLAEHGLLLDDLGEYEYTGSHRDCAGAVISGRFDAGGMQDTMGRRMAEEGLLRIIYTSEPYPSSGIAANRDVPPEVIEKVKRALLDFKPKGKDAEGLYNWDRTEMPGGFTEARDEDYDELREWRVKFGFPDDSARRNEQ